MADSKISALTDGTAPQNTDEFVVARGTGNNKLSWSELVTGVESALAANVYKTGATFTFPGENAFAAGTMTQSSLIALPFFIFGHTAVTFASVAVSVTTSAAASTVRLGWYDVAADGGPGALLYDLGTVDSSTTGVKTIASAFTIGPGLVWFASCAQGGAPGVRKSDGSTPGPTSIGPTGLYGGSLGVLTSQPVGGVFASAACTGALPNPFSTYTNGGITMPRPLFTVQ